MAIAGRKPKPAQLRLLEGNRGHRPIREAVKAAPVAPPCPAWLSSLARTEWKRIAPELERLGLLAKVDMAALSGYCENYAVLVQCSNHIKRKGGYAKYLVGASAQTAPHLAAMNKAWEKIRAFCTEFGMTPSSRGRIQVPTGRDESNEDLD